MPSGSTSTRSGRYRLPRPRLRQITPQITTPRATRPSVAWRVYFDYQRFRKARKLTSMCPCCGEPAAAASMGRLGTLTYILAHAHPVRASHTDSHRAVWLSVRPL